MLSIIIPCFNEEAIIYQTYLELTNVLTQNNLSYELIFIDDGSTDQTLEILKSIAENRVHTISFSRNFGHQAAVSAGVKNCCGDYAVIIDADLQDPPDLIPQMLSIALNDSANVVYAVRKTRKGETRMKKMTAFVYYRLLDFLSDIKIPKDTGDFRLIDRTIINIFNSLDEKQKYIRGLISWIGFKQVPIYYDRNERRGGKTHYPFLKMIKFAMFGLTYFTTKPLKIATSIGLISILISLVLIIYVFISKFFYSQNIISGWASVLMSIIFFGGVQLVSIGIIGEYLANVFHEVKNRPEYIIKENIKN